jgi:hypothetical protein
MSIGRARPEISVLVHDAIIDFEGPALSPAKLREIRSEPVYVQPGAKGFSFVRKRVSQPLITLMVVVGLVLLIACAKCSQSFAGASHSSTAGNFCTVGGGREPLAVSTTVNNGKRSPGCYRRSGRPIVGLVRQ